MSTNSIEENVRPFVNGKFIQIKEEKFYIKGVTYGTFAPDINEDQFPSLDIVETDFSLMTKIGINTVRTYTVPPISILDVALKWKLKVMVGLPWEQHLTFLESKKQSRNIINEIKNKAIKCKKHPAILCYAIGNEIPSRNVRWYGEKKITKFLQKLYEVVKEVDPMGLVTYVNYPTTEYLHLPFLDFDCFNIFLESEEKLSKYLSRLHNLTGDKPLVLAEIGLDSIRNGLKKQAEVLKLQIETIFERGCAGAFIFAWTDEWWRGGANIEDWDFGIVDRNRKPKPAFNKIQKAFKNIPFSTNKQLPKFSIVVCSYNGASTIRDTLEGLTHLDYPYFEIIVVNDGSTDNTEKIAGEYNVMLISTENKGLSCARNTGLYSAKGDIVAYIDDDAYPDPHWLTYLASAYLRSSHAGIGGPNIAPFGDGPIADCIANAPGGPVHVLHNDEIAEHIPGCNMSFKKSVLMEIGGFNPVYRAAGDDVDICWKVQKKGYTIGFHPSAFVWHHCRNSFTMYWKQQKGYGKAEALLEKKWPEKYNILGHLTWIGRLYGNGITKPLKTSKEKIFFGHQGTALFQSVYQPAVGFIRSLPLMPEWYILMSLLAFLSILGVLWKPLLLAFPVLIGTSFIVVIQACQSSKHSVFNNKPDTYFRKLKYWGFTSFLHIVQPIARMIGRINHGLNPWRPGFKYLGQSGKYIFSKNIIKHWSEEWKSAEDWLSEIKIGLNKQHNNVKIGDIFDRWDIQNRVGLFASVRSIITIEEHGMGKQYLILRKQTIISKIAICIWVISILITVFAFLDNAIAVYIVLGIWVSLYGLKILNDVVGALSSIDVVMKTLPDGVEEKYLFKNVSQPELESKVNIPQFFSTNRRRKILIGNGSPSKLNISMNNKINQEAPSPISKENKS